MGVESLTSREMAVLGILLDRPEVNTPRALAGLRELDLSAGQARRVLADLQDKDLVVQRLDESWRLRRRARAALAGGTSERVADVGPVLDDRHVRRAISSVQRRSERQQDLDRLALTFVDAGFIDRLDNDNNQIVYGRRGTGKTHVLRILDRALSEREAALSLYVDLRMLGSSSIFEDSGRPMSVRVATLLQDLLAAVHGALVDAATDPDRDVSEQSVDRLDALADAISRSTLSGELVRTESETTADEQRGRRLGIAIGLKPGLEAGLDRQRHQNERAAYSREGNPLDHVIFAEVNGALENALIAIHVERFVLLLDEWNAIPLELQPLLAEFLKRTLFTLPQATIKIATLEYRSRFAQPLGQNNVVGFETGADISTALELDDYFVFDRNPRQTERTFAELLYRHVGLETELDVTTQRFVGPEWRGSLRTLKDNLRLALPEDELEFRYLFTRYGVDGGDSFVNELFADRVAFRELVRAGEGVTRDLINIFAAAHDEARRSGETAITLDAVRRAANQWFESDKAPNMAGPQAAVLDYISGEVLAKHGERIFFLPKQDERHDAIRSLFDFRLLHLVHRGYPDPDSPVRRFNVYALDYGFYVQLLDTPQAPASAGSGIDNRSWARRVILSGEELDAAWRATTSGRQPDVP